jgi:hypothetical protein
MAVAHHEPGAIDEKLVDPRSLFVPSEFVTEKWWGDDAPEGI